MDKADRNALIAFSLVILVALGVALAGSQGGASVRGMPIFALAVGVIFAIQWLGFIAAYALQTEMFYDLTMEGSIGEQLSGWLIRISTGWVALAAVVGFLSRSLVTSEFRRRGVAGMLYDTGEKFAEARGQETLYNWIHPNNDAIIAFLKKRGYDVLNLIEVRRRRPGEEAAGVIQVGDHRYAY